MKYYDILESKQTDDTATIKKAYYNLCRKHHPDKPGGDMEKMKEITEAWAIIVDPVERKKYDELGDDNYFGKKEAQSFKGEVVSLVSSIITSPQFMRDYETVDLFTIVKGLLEQKINSIEEQLDKTKETVRYLLKVKKRVTCTEKDDLIGGALVSLIQQNKQMIVHGRKEIEKTGKMIKYLKQYQYEIDEEEEEEDEGFGQINFSRISMRFSGSSSTGSW